MGKANIQDFSRRTSASIACLASREALLDRCRLPRDSFGRKQRNLHRCNTVVILKHIGLFSTQRQSYSWIGSNRKARLSWRTFFHALGRKLQGSWSSQRRRKTSLLTMLVMCFCSGHESFLRGIHSDRAGLRRASSTGGKTGHGNR